MRIPDATYRLQFNAQFGFREAAEIIPYLKELGISDLYASPIFEAVPGSAHGYDVCNPDRLNPELGTAEDFERLAQAVKSAGMGWVQDIVPNHMAFSSCNWRLMDALENGDSFYRSFFDIDWEHPVLAGKVLAPFLGSHYARCLESGEIALVYSGGDGPGLSIRYGDLRWPVALESYPGILEPGPNDLEAAEEDDLRDYRTLFALLKEIESPESSPAENPADRAAVLKERIADLYNRSAAVRTLVNNRVCEFECRRNSSGALLKLDSLISAQRFKPVYWRDAESEINYRRFFLINGLIGLRAEEEAAFVDTHALILKLAREGRFSGLRVDHIDGLYDPRLYLNRLRNAAPDQYIILEKILDRFEDVPSSWPVQGTTGYEFLNHLNALYCDVRNETAFTGIYERFTGNRITLLELLSRSRRSLLEESFSGDLDNYARLLHGLARRDRRGRDFTFRNLRRALREFLVAFPVYRSYADLERMDDPDRNNLRVAFEEAVLHHPELAWELCFLEGVFALDQEKCGEMDETGRERWRRALMRVQQIMGALMAKGLEDNAFYIFNRFISLNEVGGSPHRFGTPVSEFHRFIQHRMDRRPHSLNAASTHDTKRGEDARARLNVISEIPDDWEKNVRQWAGLNRRKKPRVKDKPVPDSNTEYFLYQSMIGGFPFQEEDLPAYLDRLEDAMIKAVREAGVCTSWNDPDQDFEAALRRFIRAIFKSSPSNRFLPPFIQFQRRIAFYGVFNSLSQTLIRITAPGVPDFYRGTENWDLSFVDPDNRRPVDFEARAAQLNAIRGREDAAGLPDLLKEMLLSPGDGRLKLFLIRRALAARRARRDLFLNGNYVPLAVEGPHRDSIVAFQRSHQGRCAVTVAPRFLSSVITQGEFPFGREIWKETALELPAKTPVWREAITGAEVKAEGGTVFIGDVLQRFPVGLLINPD